ncbi:MAG: pyrroline-5-carboxylate reductase [Nitrospira sp.]|nr:pyrroline-5-carboxylate reductase [Nitrospira sp.]
MKEKSIKSLGLIGAGKMGTALTRGLLETGVLNAKQILASDPAESALEQLKQQTEVRVTSSNAEVAKQSEIILIAVKPDVVRLVLQEIRPLVSKDQLVISIAAGITLKVIEEGLDQGCRVVRVMPNTPCLVGAGAAAFSIGKNATPEDARLVKALFETVGLAVQVQEKHLDAVTGLSASGPAYVFLMIESLSDGGVKMGLSRSVATQLAAQAVFGAAKMVLEMKKHPAELKDLVTSPGGTTIAGLHALESRAFGAALIDAVEAATRKAKELGKNNEG